MAIELFLKGKKSRSPAPSAESQRLTHDFRSVKNAEDCIRVMQSTGLMSRTGVSDESASVILQICNNLRKDGMELEPNLVGRAAVSAMSDNVTAGRAAVMFSRKDTDFTRLVEQADRSRDEGNYPGAQYHYWRALQLYPSHPAYIVQYAHCLKERGLIEDAFVNYVDAFRFGALAVDVQQHAEFTAERSGHGDVGHLFHASPAQSGDTEARQRELTTRDIKTGVLAFHLEEASVARVAAYLCKYGTREALMSALVQEARFLSAHRDLLLLLKETAGEIR
ncbi:hypothetical protein PWR63_04490 [Paraburkholderia sp. A2WS-5]|uniref:hypothetical protein n=1 Tax=Paraburkholderia sp. A2WS-5 TaxID=3028372 RepID=UPI003B797816